jgi:hypothetical protein
VAVALVEPVASLLHRIGRSGSIDAMFNETLCGSGNAVRRQHAQSRTQQFWVAPKGPGGKNATAQQSQRRLVAKIRHRADPPRRSGRPIDRRKIGNGKVGALYGVKAAFRFGAR